MLWLFSVVFMSISPIVLSQNDQVVDPDSIRSLLHEAATEVLRRHASEMSQVSPAPMFDVTQGFMRSYLPNTGVLNRDELVVERIQPVEVYTDSAAARLLLQRHNNTDYALGVRDGQVFLTYVELDARYFAYDEDHVISTYETDKWSLVRDACLFTRSHRNYAPLSMAILTVGAKNNVLSVHEVHGEEALVVGMIDLGGNSAKKVLYAQSQYGGSLIVLIDTPQEEAPKLVYRHKDSSELNNFIEVHYPSGIDMVTFTVHGRAYIAAANATSCHVYKMDLHVSNHTEFDRLTLPSGDLSNLEYFRLGFYHYLALTGRSHQYLYTWKSGQFSLNQAFTIPDVQQLYAVPLPTCRDDVILFLVHSESTEMYVYDGKADKFVQTNAAVPADFRISPRTLAAFVANKKAVLLFLDQNNQLNAFAVESSLKSLPNPVIKMANDMSMKMQILQEMLEDQNSQVREIKQVLSQAVRSTGDQHITASQQFEDLRSFDETIVQEFEEPIHVEWDGSELTLQQYKDGTKALEEKVVELERLIEDIERRIPDIVRIDQPTNITGTKKFYGELFGSSVSAMSVNLDFAAGINVPKLQKELYRLDRPEKVKGTLTFEKPLTILEDLTTGSLGDLNINDIMTTNTEQISYAQMNFENKVKITGDLEVSGRLNDIDIRSELVTLHGSHIIKGKTTFNNGIKVVNMDVGVLDGIDVNVMYETAVTKSGRQDIRGTKTFKNVLTSTDITLHGLFNGYNLTALADSIVRVDKPAVISGHKIFTNDVSFESTLSVGQANNMRIPQDLFLTDVEQQVLVNKDFVGSVVANDVLVSGTVDGLKIPDDIVTLTRPEKISGTVYFKDGIYAESDIIVGGLVDGVDISEVAKEAIKLNETNLFENAVFLGPVTVTGNIDVKGTVNNVDLRQVVADIVFKDDENIIIDSKKNFGTVVSNSVKLDGMLNGYNLTVDFMKVNGDQVIPGKKIFKDKVTFNSIVVDSGMVGGLNVSKLHENVLSLVVEDETSDVTFVDNVIVEGDLTVSGTIGGLRIPEDIVLKNSNGDIRNKVFVADVNVDNLIVNGDAEISGSFGNIDLNLFDEERLSLTRDQTIEGDLWIKDGAVKTMELSGDINGVDIVELKDNVMSKTLPQVITGKKTFSGFTNVLGPITTNHGINGYNLKELNSRAFKLKGEENVVTELLEFDDMTVNDIKVIGYVNSVNLSLLAYDSLKKDYSEEQFVSGQTTFEYGFHVHGDIDAATVNGLVLRDDILLKSLPQDIKGDFTMDNLNVGGDLNVRGLVNGLDLSDVSNRLLTAGGEPLLYSNITFLSPVYVSGDIDVSGFVNGVNLQRISEDLLLRDGNQSISGNKIIRGAVTVKGDVDVDLVNGRNWQNFLNDVVRTDVPQAISSQKTFLNDVKVKDMHSEISSIETINDGILNVLTNDAVFVDVPTTITGKKVFLDDVEMQDLNADLINGLQLKTDVITLMCNDEAPQKITGQKTFSNLISHGNLHVLGNVNSHQLYDLYQDTLLVEGEQTVTGHKVIQKEVLFAKNVYPDEVNGMQLQRDLVTLHTDQTLHGNYSFNSDLVFEKDLIVEGLINNINLTELAGDAVYLHMPQRIDGEYSIDKVLTPSDVAVDGLVNGIDLHSLDKNISEFLGGVRLSLNELDKHADEACDAAKYVQDAMSKSFYVLDGFVVQQELPSSASFVSKSSSHNLILIQRDEMPFMTSYHWERGENKFIQNGETSQTAIARKIVQDIGASLLEVNVGINYLDSFVSIDGNSVSMLTGFNDAAIVLKSSREIVIGLLYTERGICEFHRVVTSSGGSPLIESYDSANVGKDAVSIVMFEIGDVSHVAVARHQLSPYQRGFSRIMSRISGNWQRTQTIPIAASSFVGHFVENDRHHLVFSSVAPVYETREPKSIQVYRNLDPRETHFSLFQKIPFNNALGFDSFRFGDLSELYLNVWNETTVQVFRLEGESGFRTAFTLQGQCIKDVKSLIIDGDLYLVVGQHDINTARVLPSVLYRGLVKGSRFSPQGFLHC